MQIRSRRKLDMALLGGGALVTAAACAIAAFAGNGERISSFWTGAERHRPPTSW